MVPLIGHSNGSSPSIHEKNAAQQYVLDSYIKLSSVRYRNSSHRVYNDKFENNKQPIAIPTRTELSIMKFTLPTLIALFTALPALAFVEPKPLAFELSQDLVIEIVTPWTDAYMNGGTVVTGDLVKVDDHEYHRLDSYTFKKGKTVAGAYFGLSRESWEDQSLQVSLLHTVAWNRAD